MPIANLFEQNFFTVFVEVINCQFFSYDLSAYWFLFLCHLGVERVKKLRISKVEILVYS